MGTFAIQLAKHLGATVATTTSTANVDLVRSLGADIVIDYKKEDFAHVIRDYDVALNSLDTRNLSKCLSPGDNSFLFQARRMPRLREASARHGC